MAIFPRPVLLLLCSLLLLTISMAVLNTMVPLWLSHASFTTGLIGIVSSGYFAGNLVGTLLAGKMISRLGIIHSYYLSCLLFAFATISMLWSIEFWYWSVCRFFAGIACAFIWVIVESALLQSGDLNSRGRLLAAYMIVYYLGTVIGQLLLGWIPVTLQQMLPKICTLVLLAILPILFIQLKAKQSSDERKQQRISVLLLFKRHTARLGIIGCIISGVILGSIYSLMPLYFLHQGLSSVHIGYWMALIVSAGIIGQWPVGCMTERYGRVIMLRILSLALVLGSIMMLGHSMTIGALLMLGCSGFTLYPVAMAWACEYAQPCEIVAMNQVLLLSYTVGSLSGPAIASQLMQNYSDNLLFVSIIVVALIYIILLFRADKQQTSLSTS